MKSPHVKETPYALESPMSRRPRTRPGAPLVKETLDAPWSPHVKETLDAPWSPPRSC